MKIGIVCYPTFGGSGVVATELGLALAAKGHHIHFITYRRPARLNTFHENIYFHEVNAAEYPLFEHSQYDTALASKMVDVAIYEKLDLLHVHYAIPHASVAFLAKSILKTKGIKLPVITTLHGTDITLVGADPSFAPVVEFSINVSDGVTAVSDHLKQQTLNTFDITTNIEVIYNFIDFARFKKTNKNHFKLAIAPEGEKIITHVSNFRKVKRVEDVIRVFEKVHNVIPSKLFMIGDGPERQGVEKLCREIGICDDIRFMGKQEAVEDLLNISDLFIIPSQNESFGLAALEAMACEVPVISTNAGGLPEVNIHGVTGYLSDVGDVDDMAKNAIAILSDEKLHEKMKKGAFETSLKFHIDMILPQYEAYYKSIFQKVNSEELIS